ncbi:MAG: DNA topoisomerase I [archaeon GW2011_AR19]|nr:MAG: DNA topoisomerase I [archaeon GW2011_AR19]
MNPKQKKTREENAAEGHFIVSKEDVKHATEKSVKEQIADKKYILKNVTEKPIKESIQNVFSVEKEYSAPTKKAIEKIEPKRKNKSNKNSLKKTPAKYIIPKITLNQTGYELIITEKPQAALKISNALGKTIQKDLNKVPYYEVNRNGKEIIVGCAVGHLFTLKQNSSAKQIPSFDISWTPNYIARKKDFTKRYYDALLKLIKGAGSLTIATDYDTEGEVIGMNIMKYLCNQKDASRMKFSTLTKDELENSYENKSAHINWGQAIAGETRHYLDWFYGINLSRALMDAIKTTGKFRIMSIGRVQGPALNMIVQKEKEIQAFKPETYWQVFITIDDGINGLELKHNKDIFGSDGAKKELEKFNNLKGKKAKTETKKTEQKLPPPFPFNLTNLQTEAYKFYGITPSRTLQIAQSLYLAGLISYPRTSSQKLPASIGYGKILNQLAEEFKVKKLITRKTPVEGEKSDPAHPSIYPTGNKQILSGEEKKIYELIVKRFLSLFCDDAIIDSKTVTAEINRLKFSVKGQAIRKKTWLEIYPSKLKEDKIPNVNGNAEILDSRTEQKETQPPRRYSPASIISELEKRNLGTKSTRSSILETLYDRNYIEGQSIKATPFGISLIESLEKYSPIIIDEKLTHDFEEDMEEIGKIYPAEENKKTGLNKKLLEKEQNVINKSKEIITSITKDFKKNEKKIGEELIDASIKFREQQKRENTLIKCPKCKNGDLIINYSKKNRRFFVACNAYPECRNTYSLPPNGVIKKTTPAKICEECGYPMVMRLAKGKRPWIFCWNPQCKTNLEWVEKREERNNSENKLEKSE